MGCAGAGARDLPGKPSFDDGYHLGRTEANRPRRPTASLRFQAAYSARTGRNGRFRFDRLPPMSGE